MKKWMVLIMIVAFSLGFVGGCSSGNGKTRGDIAAEGCDGKQGRTWVDGIKRFIWCVG